MKLTLKQKIFLLFLTGVVVLGFTLFFQRAETTQLFNQRQAVKFEEQLNKAEKQLSDRLSKFVQDASGKNLDYVFQEYSGKKKSESSTGYFIYRNDTLVLWSHNLYPVPEVLEPGQKLAGPLKFPNGWYASRFIAENEYVYLAVKPIKFEFPHQNNYLNDHFVRPFIQQKSAQLTYNLSQADYVIKKENGDAAIGLIYPDSKKLVPPDITIILLFFVGIVALFSGYWLALSGLWFRRSPFIRFFLFALGLILIRMLMIEFEFPNTLYSTVLFGPELYASSEYFPSLGDFLLNSLSILFMAITLPVIVPYGSKNRVRLLSVLYWTVILGFTTITALMGRGLVLHSSITFMVTNILSLSVDSVSGISAIVILLASAVILAIRISAALSQLPAFEIFFGWIIATIAHLIIVLVSGVDFITIVVWPFVISLFLLLIRVSRKNFSFGSSLLLLIIFSAFSAYLITWHSLTKERKARILLAERLSAENDPVAEYLYIDLEERLESDERLDSLAARYWSNQDKAEDYLRQNFFYGFWDKYELRTTFCSETDSLIVNPGNFKTNCIYFFDSLIANQATSVRSGSLYFMKMMAGRISYLAKVDLFPDSTPVSLFIELHSKFIPEGTGYPELLLDQEEIRRNPDRLNFSFARYHNDTMVMSSVNGSYSSILPPFARTPKKINIVEIGDRDHLIYRSTREDVIILTRKAHTLFDDLTTFSYFFTIYSLLTLTYFFFWQVRRGFMGWLYRFKTRIQLLFIGTIILSILLFGLGTVYYIEKQYRSKNDSVVSEKLRSILIEIETKLGHEKNLNQQMAGYLSYYLVKFSNVFFADINMYDLEGNLLASSRPEIFSQGLISTRMNAEAFHSLKHESMSEFIHEEEIGKLTYLSAYVPFRNTDGKILAYLNLPYFAKQNELENEISTFLVALINIYVLLLIISVTIAVFISNYVTRPVQLIREKLRNVRLGTLNEPINWHSRDELGSLIKEYNRMIRELSDSAEKLARSERETAWREMAKQVAHEIKNPLTPMKLSIQYLQKTWDDKAEDFDDKLERISKTLIEQIDTLSNIATEFSNFAKMPRPVFEPVDLIGILEGVAELHRDDGNVKVMFETTVTRAMVYAGKDQMLRAFNNLIKNAIQAIPDNQEGKVLINLESEGENFLVKVTDNGVGIDEEVKSRVFEPSFTTKTGGMGLGLAMVKNIVEMTGGEIWFETRTDAGTTFFIRLPAYEPGNSVSE